MRVRTGRIILIAVAAILLALAGSGISYLRSARFQEKARAAIIARIEQATGLRVQIERLTFDILRGTFKVQAAGAEVAQGDRQPFRIQRG